MDEDTSIKVAKATRERLAELAQERGTTIRGLVESLAASAPTRAEQCARAEVARAELRERFGVEVTARDEAAGHALWDELLGGRTSGAAGAA
ncbi:hypothetical protein [Yinghuangia sp. YIM S09857]|uniref:hypothetical protein n=1 Tax=Yinghuangia sp. YIM S09857 TaxID=3436929 RepID=UPI003F53186B